MPLEISFLNPRAMAKAPQAIRFSQPKAPLLSRLERQFQLIYLSQAKQDDPGKLGQVVGAEPNCCLSGLWLLASSEKDRSRLQDLC